MAQHGAVGAGQERRGLGPKWHRRVVADGEHAGVLSVKSAPSDQLFDHAVTDAGGV
jgi:hypothetical protein